MPRSHAFERAIEALAAAGRSGRRIEFYGVGNSGIVAQDAQHKFFRLGVNTTAVQRRPRPGDERDDAAARRLRGDHQQLGPQPRPARRRRDRAHARARRRSSSPPAARRWRRRRRAQPQQILLAADHPEDYDRYSPMVSRLLHLMVIDILTTAVALRLGRRAAADAAGDQAQPAREALREPQPEPAQLRPLRPRGCSRQQVVHAVQAASSTTLGRRAAHREALAPALGTAPAFQQHGDRRRIELLQARCASTTSAPLPCAAACASIGQRPRSPR